MAIHNEILVGRFNRFLQKALSMKGPPPAPQLAGEHMAVIPWEPVERAEWRYLCSWDRFANRIFQAANAASNGAIRMRNPAGSNVIAVLERCTISNPLLEDIVVVFGAQTSDLTTGSGAASTRLDSRGRSASTIVFSQQANLAIPGTFAYQLDHPASSYADLILEANMEWPMLPGDALTLQDNIVNQNFVASFLWRERALEESERF